MDMMKIFLVLIPDICFQSAVFYEVFIIITSDFAVNLLRNYRNSI